MSDETYTPATYVVREDGLSDVQNILPGDVFDFGIGVLCTVTGTGTEPDPLGGPDLIRIDGTEVAVAGEDGLSTYHRSFHPACRVAEVTGADEVPEYLVTEYDYDWPEEPSPRAYCDVYDVHEPHLYLAYDTNTYQCPGMSKAEAERLESIPDCEHGLSSDLCCGPNHYPADH